jgi:serine/threonine protein kinase
MVLSQFKYLISVLLSINDKAWKITDFGLTFEGTSRHKYTTQSGRGTQGYRAIELLREERFVTKASDIWALGCIFYELAFKEKLFSTDFKVYDYAYGPRKLEIRHLEVEEQISAYVREFVYRMLEIDWWKRPTTTDILQLLDTLSNQSASCGIYYIGQAELPPQPSQLNFSNSIDLNQIEFEFDLSESPRSQLFTEGLLRFLDS